MLSRLVTFDLRASVVQTADALLDEFQLPPNYHRWSGRVQLVVKRLFDVIGAIVGGVLLAPAFGVIALAIWIDSGRPILYQWRVVGRRGRYFTGYKFRTMVPDADRMYQALRTRNEMRGPVFKMKDDPRVTRIGRVLRKYSLDELPQLWSILLGRMSFVGPRPPLQREWEEFEPWQRRKLAVTPGLTCLWQVSGRADIQDFNEWARLDLEYIERWSLWLDWRILCRTVGAVLSRRGAY